MQIPIKQLATSLKRKLEPLYLIHGDVPLLAEEARDIIRATAIQAGYQNFELLVVDPKFKWSLFTNLTDNLSLFSEKTIIDVRINNNTLDEKGVEAILDYCAHPSSSHLLLISMEKLTSAQQKTKWYKALEETGAIITIWPLNAAELHQSILQRLQHAHLKATQDSISLLMEMTEGNLLATQQTIDKLQLLFPNGTIDVEKMQQAIADNARFNVFDLTNNVLQGNTKHALRVLTQLRLNGAETPHVLWALCRELRELIDGHYQLTQGQSLQQVLLKQWASRKTLLQMALRRTTLKQVKACLHFASEVDQTIKGQKLGDSWEAMGKLVLMFSQ